MNMSFLIEIIIAGVVIGAIYAAVALGFVLIYKATGVLNIAQGELLLFGALVAYAFSVEVGLPFYLAALLTLAMCFILGFIIERAFLRPMIGQPILSVIMMTIGLAALFRGIVMAIWGTAPRAYPNYLSTEPVHLLGTALSPIYLWSLLIVVVLLILFVLFFRFTRMGIAMRATADDQQVAQSMGISIKRVFGTAWAISTATAALGGIILGTMLSISTPLSGIGLKSISAAIVGGLESIPGVFVGGLLVGVLENLAGGYLSSYLIGIKGIAPYIILLLIMLIRPHGLFGLKRIERI